MRKGLFGIVTAALLAVWGFSGNAGAQQAAATGSGSPAASATSSAPAGSDAKDAAPAKPAAKPAVKPVPTGLERLSDEWPKWLKVNFVYRGRVESTAPVTGASTVTDWYSSTGSGLEPR